MQSVASILDRFRRAAGVPAAAVDDIAGRARCVGAVSTPLLAATRTFGLRLVRRKSGLEPIHGARGADGDQHVAGPQNRVARGLRHELAVCACRGPP